MTSIEWTRGDDGTAGKTWNPFRGCTKISQGCKHCYAATFAERWRGIPGHAYERGFEPRFVPEQLDAPLRWRKPRRVFVNSMSDLFHEAFTNEQIAAVFGVMAACQQHTFQILTKRAGWMRRWFEWLSAEAISPHGPSAPIQCGIHAANFGSDVDYLGLPDAWPLPNVWLGVSAENQEQADKRIPELLRTPAAVRFVSVEPMLGPVDLSWCLEEHSPETTGERRAPRIDWVIAGAESGHGARPMHEDWVRSLRDQCAAAGVRFFYKQRLERGRKVSLPMLDGVQHAEWPG